MLLTYIFLFILGTILGSFLNVVIFRLPENRSVVKESSACRKCKAKLKPVELIPIFSYLILKGKCKSCKEPISWQYPVVEFVTGLFFVLFALYHQVVDLSLIDVTYVRDLIFFAGLLVIFVTDIKHYLIFDAVTYPMMLAALALNIFIFGLSWAVLLNVLIAVLVGGGFFAVQYFISKGKWLGFGDVKMGILMGFMLGWPNVLVAIILSYMIGSIVSIILLLTGQKKLTSKIPMGIFLTVSTVIVLLYGTQIVNWYLGLL